MPTATVGAGKNPVSVVVDPSGRYAYVANQGSKNVSQYMIDANGGLTPIATAEVGTRPNCIAVDPSGRYVYVVNNVSDNVSQYTIGADGRLVPMTTPAITAGSRPHSIAVDPSGRSVYVTNAFNPAGNVNAGSISQYIIDASGGLTPMATPTVPTATLGGAIVTTGPLQ